MNGEEKRLSEKSGESENWNASLFTKRWGELSVRGSISEGIIEKSRNYKKKRQTAAVKTENKLDFHPPH